MSVTPVVSLNNHTGDSTDMTGRLALIDLTAKLKLASRGHAVTTTHLEIVGSIMRWKVSLAISRGLRIVWAELDLPAHTSYRQDLEDWQRYPDTLVAEIEDNMARRRLMTGGEP